MLTDRTTPPVIHDAVDFDFNLPAINNVQLASGIPLHWLNAGVQDVVQIDWIFPAGIWYEHKASVAQATAGLLKSGTESRTAAAISEALEFYGAQLKVSAGNDYATLSLYALTRHLPALLPVVADILSGAIFPEKEVEIYKRNAVQKLLVSLRQCEFVANQKIDAYLYGEQHPYGRYSRREGIEALTREDLLTHFNTYYNLANVRMFMAGNVSEKEVKLLDEIFGNVTNSGISGTERKEFPLQSAQERMYRINNDPNGVQGAIRIGRLFPNRHHPDYTPMVVLNTLFGGYFGSRLMSNIREDKGYTYGIYSSLAPELNGGSLTIHTEVGTGVLEAAVKEIYHEMEQLCASPVDDEELLLVKNYLLGGLLGDLDGPFSIMRRWRSLILNGFDAAQFHNNVHIYKSITPAELQLLAQKYLQPTDFYELAVI